jgi:hypothetical protein
MSSARSTGQLRPVQQPRSTTPLPDDDGEQSEEDRAYAWRSFERLSAFFAATARDLRFDL